MKKHIKDLWIWIKREFDAGILLNIILKVSAICVWFLVKKTGSDKIREYEFSIETIPQPSNIRFENTHKSSTEKLWRICLAIIIILIVMLVGFALLFSTQTTKDFLHRSYPEVDWELLMENYNHNEQLLLNFAFAEWNNIQEQGISRNSILKLSTSNLQCFWENLQSNYGFQKASDTEFSLPKRLNGRTGKIWKDFLLAEKIVWISIFLVPGIIELINFSIKTATNFSMRVIKMENKTKEASTALVIDFFLTFFNSSIVLLLMNANFNGTGIPIYFIDGFYGDFNAKWYIHVAPIFITPMFIRWILPPVMLGVSWLINRFFLILDQRGVILSKLFLRSLPQNQKDDKTNIFTSKNTNLDYTNLRSGEKLDLASPYAQILVAIMITFMFGLGLPVLFPLTLIYIIVIYLTK